MELLGHDTVSSPPTKRMSLARKNPVPFDVYVSCRGLLTDKQGYNNVFAHYVEKFAGSSSLASQEQVIEKFMSSTDENGGIFYQGSQFPGVGGQPFQSTAELVSALLPLFQKGAALQAFPPPLRLSRKHTETTLEVSYPTVCELLSTEEKLHGIGARGAHAIAACMQQDKALDAGVFHWWEHTNSRKPIRRRFRVVPDETCIFSYIPETSFSNEVLSMVPFKDLVMYASWGKRVLHIEFEDASDAAEHQVVQGKGATALR